MGPVSPPLDTWPPTPASRRSRAIRASRSAESTPPDPGTNNSRTPCSDPRGLHRTATPNRQPTTSANAPKERNTTPRSSASPAVDATSSTPCSGTAPTTNHDKPRNCPPPLDRTIGTPPCPAWPPAAGWAPAARPRLGGGAELAGGLGGWRGGGRSGPQPTTSAGTLHTCTQPVAAEYRSSSSTVSSIEESGLPAAGKTVGNRSREASR